MSTIQDAVIEIISQMTDEKTIRKWKAIARQKILKYVKNAHPFKGIEPSNYYFWIDTKSRTFGITMYGVKPNAAAARGFSAPVDKREPSLKPIKIHINGEWKTVHTERDSSSYLGVKPLDTEYYGVSDKPNRYFGLKRGKRVEAFGIADEKAVPVYSNDGFVEWITTDAADELADILRDAGYTALNGGK